jgi:transposase
MPPFLGLDVSKDSVAACLLLDDRRFPFAFDNNRRGVAKLLNWLRNRKAVEGLRACLEPTNTYHIDLAKALHEAGVVVHVANPWATLQYAKSTMRRLKTDKADAEILALYAKTHSGLKPWKPLPEELATLLSLVRHRVALVDQRTAVCNQKRTPADPAVTESLDRLIAFLTHEIELADQAIEEHVKAHPDLDRDCELLRSIPGIGAVTAPLLLAELGDYSRFDNVRQVAAYAGLTPQAHESGTSVHGRPRLSRIGSRRLRCALYMPAVVVFGRRSIFAPLTERLLAENRHKMTIIAALMRKLLHVAYGVLKSQSLFNAGLAGGTPTA